jgi:hypothetical protein
MTSPAGDCDWEVRVWTGMLHRLHVHRHYAPVGRWPQPPAAAAARSAHCYVAVLAACLPCIGNTSPAGPTLVIVNMMFGAVLCTGVACLGKAMECWAAAARWRCAAGS